MYLLHLRLTFEIFLTLGLNMVLDGFLMCHRLVLNLYLEMSVVHHKLHQIQKSSRENQQILADLI